MPRAKKVDTIQEVDALPTPMPGEGDVSQDPLVTLRYSAEDMDKLDQFAIGLLGPNSGAGYSNDEIFESRVRAAYLRAEVVLTIRKEIAALEV